MDVVMDIEKLITDFEEYLSNSFHELWSKVQIEPNLKDAYSVIGGLLSRQVTLAIQMARSPAIWNGHSAPLFLRAMTDLHISLAWIMLDIEERSKKYILHGLGEEKLLIEHYKASLEETENEEDKADIQQMIEMRSALLNSQKRDYLVAVDLGQWSQLDYRKMSQQSDCEGLYKFAYKPFSHVAHNMWPHISLHNLKRCDNPLHRHHLIPDLIEIPIDIDYLYRACKYVDMAYSLFMEQFEITVKVSPLDWWCDYFDNLNIEDEAQNTSEE